MSWTSGSPQLIWADVWSVNLAAGTFSVATGTSYEAENGVVAGSATIPADPSFSGGKAVGFLGQLCATKPELPTDVLQATEVPLPSLYRA
jgi:hypothetical protein